MEVVGSGDADYIFPQAELQVVDFNPAAFVAKYRRISSLESLKAQLRQYSESLKQQLFLIINRDYRDFIGIATKLDGVDTRVEVLRRPLVDLRLDLSALHDWLMSSRQAMESKLDRRLAIRQRRERVEGAVKCLDKLDVAEMIIDGSGSSSGNGGYIGDAAGNDDDNGDNTTDRGSSSSSGGGERSMKRREVLKSLSKLQRLGLASASAFASGKEAGVDSFTRACVGGRSLSQAKDIFEASELERAAHALASARDHLGTLQRDGFAKRRNDSVTEDSSPAPISIPTVSSSDANSSSNTILLEQRYNRLTEHLVAKVRGWVEECLVDSSSSSSGGGEAEEMEEEEGGNEAGANNSNSSVREQGQARLLMHCMRALVVLDRADVAETAVAASLLPHIKATLTQGRVDGASGRGSFGGLGQALVALVHKLDAPLVALLRTSEDMGLDLVVGGVWVPVATMVSERFPSIFSIGIASIFADAYRAFDRFNSALCGDDLLGPEYYTAVRTRLATDPRVTAFQKKWNLGLYLRLRSQEVCGRLDSACASCGSSISGGGDGGDGISTNVMDIVYPSKEALAAHATAPSGSTPTSGAKPGKLLPEQQQQQQQGKSKHETGATVTASKVFTAATLPPTALQELRSKLALPSAPTSMNSSNINSSSSSSSNSDYQFRLSLSLVCATEAATCLHDKVHFAALSGECLALALRCAVRFEAHVAALLGVATPSFPKGPAVLRGAVDTAGKAISVSALDNTAAGNKGGGPSTPSKGGGDSDTSGATPAHTPRTASATTPATGAGAVDSKAAATNIAAGGASLDDLVLLANDLHTLARWFLGAFQPYAAGILGLGVTTEVEAAVQETAAKLNGTASAVWAHVTALLSAECKAQLAAVRSVAGRYRMTNRPAPSAPSPYVATIFVPLTAFLTQYGAATAAFAPRDNATDTAVSTWDHQVAEEVTAAFCVHVASVMETAKQMDSALSRRVKATAASTSVSSAAATDSDKINLQLRLDVDAYTATLGELLTGNSNSKSDSGSIVPSLQKLLEIVTP